MNNKKWLVRVVSLTAMFGLTLGLGIFAACTPSVTPGPDDNPPGGTEHTHSYTEWAHDGTQHWKVCPDDNTADESTKANHSFVEGVCECGATENGDQPDVPDVLDQRSYFLVGNGQGTIKASNWTLAPAPAAVTFTRVSGTNTYELKNFELMVGDEMKLGFASEWGNDSAYAFGAYFFSKASDVFEASEAWADNAVVANGKSGKYNITLVTAGANTSSTAVAEEQIVEFKFELVESYEVTTEDMGWYLTGAMNNWAATGPTNYKLEETSKGSGIWEGTFTFPVSYEMKAIHFTKTTNKGNVSYAVKWSNESNHTTPAGTYKMTYNAKTDNLTHTAAEVVVTYYTVTFVTNGAGEVPAQTVKSGDKATAPTGLTKEGHNFGGWFTDEALTQSFSFGTAITKDITLYAKWVPVGSEQGAEWVLNENGQITAWNGDATVLTFPETVDGVTVKGVTVDAFLYSANAGKITKLVLDRSLTIAAGALDPLTGCTEVEYTGDMANSPIAGQTAFNARITKATFAENVTELPSNGLKFPNIKELNIKGSIKTINSSAYADCGIDTVELPASVTKVGTKAFTGMKNLKTINYGLTTAINTKSGASYCFFDANTGADSVSGVKLVLTETAKYIGEYFFADFANLKSIEWNTNLVAISHSAFRNSGITSLTIPAYFTADTLNGSGSQSGLGSVFYGCTKLKTITFEKESQLKDLPQNTFNGCTSLKEIELPEGMTGLTNTYVFRGCTSLETVVLPSTLGEFTPSAFLDVTIVSLTLKYPMVVSASGNKIAVDGNAKIYVPENRVADYKADAYWSAYADFIVGFKVEFGDENCRHESVSFYYAKGSIPAPVAEGGEIIAICDDCGRDVPVSYNKGVSTFSGSVATPTEITSGTTYGKFSASGYSCSAYLGFQVTAAGTYKLNITQILDTSTTKPWIFMNSILMQKDSYASSLTGGSAVVRTGNYESTAHANSYKNRIVTAPLKGSAADYPQADYIEFNFTEEDIGLYVTVTFGSSSGASHVAYMLVNFGYEEGVGGGGDVGGGDVEVGDYGWTIDDNGLLTSWKGEGTTLVIPATVNGTAVTGVAADITADGDAASKITKIEMNKFVLLPESFWTPFTNVTEIVYNSAETGQGNAYKFPFAEKTSPLMNNVTKLTFGPKVTAIPKGFASHLRGLKTVVFEGNVTAIGEKAFYWCTALETFTIPASVEDAGLGADIFKSCSKLSHVTLGENMTIIPEGMFQSCLELRNVTFPKNLKKICQYAFYSCPYLNLNVNNAFAIPDTVTVIEDNAFTCCINFRNIVIPESVQSIYSKGSTWHIYVTAFSDIHIKSLTIKSGNLINFGAEGVPVTFYLDLSPRGGFSETEYGKIYVPAQYLEAYKAAPGWSDYAEYIEAIPETVKTAVSDYTMPEAILPTKEY